MRHGISAAALLVFLLLVGSVALVAPSLGEVRGADVQVASLPDESASSQPAAKSNMTPWTQTAQVRCSGGQLIFLTSECGCKGACCACSAGARYLNHCNCQCSSGPPPAASCTKGFSVGR